MNLELYAKCVIACLLGNICHIAIKYNSLYVDYKKANVNYGFRQFIKDDKRALIVDAILSFAAVYLIDEFVIASDWILDKVKIFFFFVGLTGSYLVMQLLSVGKDKFRQIIDFKTDKADGITKPPTT
jgi:hypothetical protein